MLHLMGNKITRPDEDFVCQRKSGLMKFSYRYKNLSTLILRTSSMNQSNYTLNTNISVKDFANTLGISVQAFHKYVKENGINTRSDDGKSHKITPDVARQIAMKRGITYPHKVINVHNIKGGVGKTTSVHALASRAAALGARVLMVDLDMQANLTRSFGVDTARKAHHTMFDVVKSYVDQSANRVRDAIIPLSENLHIIPSSLQLAHLDLFLIMNSTKVAVQNLFKSIFEDVRGNYDFVFIDSPPALSQITSAAHMYSDLVAMPIEMDLFSIDGIDYNIEHINILKQNYGKNLEIAIFVNKYDGRPKADMEILETLKSSNYGRYLCDSYISMSSGLRTTIAGGQTVWESARKHPALVGFESLLFELTTLNFQVEPKKQAPASAIMTEATV